MSPILVRPVREQLEHDRIIRLLPGKYRRKFEVGINPGNEQVAGIGTGVKAIFADAVLFSPEKGRRVEAVIEVETAESINALEAQAQWAALARLRVPFHLYVPMGTVDVARRLSEQYDISVTEIWSYDNVGDQVRFTLVHKVPDPVPAPGKPIQVAVPKPPAPKAAAPEPAPVAPAAPAKPAAAKPAAAKPAAAPPKPAAVKTATAKPVVPRPAPPKPVAAKPTVAKTAKAQASKPSKASVQRSGAKPAAARKAARPAPPASRRAAARPARAASKPPAKRAKTAARTAPARKSAGAAKRR